MNGGRCGKCGGSLGERWEAHHTERFADGGVTELPNAQALCALCHRDIHRRIGVINPKDWQKDALKEFLEYHRGLSFLLEATPGAGKTLYSGFCAAALLQQKLIDFALIVVPTVAIKGDAESGFLGGWSKIGVQIKTVLKDGQDCPSSEFSGAVVTYQQLPNLVGTLETWAAKGVRLFVIFDEIHHACEENIWGSTAEKIARIATKILAMSGTPFRSDGRRISFVNYDKNGKAEPDFTYGYREAVAALVCRPVEFITDDGVAEFIRNEEQSQVRVSNPATDEEARDAARALFDRNSRWLRETIMKADAALDEYRLQDPDAGGLVVCRPGTDESDTRHLMHVAKIVSEVSGESPEVISYDDLEANAKIERFRKGKQQRWILAVRKISEGVDIPRLRVLVMATRPNTELLFRQIVGRIVRVENPDSQTKEYATAFVAKFPQLCEWAKQISDEAKAGLFTPEKKGPSDRDAPTSSQFVPLGASHEDGGAISDFGDEFTADEINAAEREKQADFQLLDIPITKLAYLRRLHNVAPEPMQAAQAPLQIRKKEIRQRINNKHRRLAFMRNGDQPDFKGLWASLLRPFGVKSLDDLMDNFSIDIMRQVEGVLDQWLAGGGSSASSAAS